MLRPFLIWLLILVMAAALNFAPLGAEVVDRIVAKVNGRIITLKELNDRLAAVVKAANIEDQAQVNELRRDVLEMLIDRELVLQEAERLRIEVSQEDVEEALVRLRTSRNMTPEQFEAEIARRGGSLELFKSDLEVDLIKSRLINMEVRSRVVVPSAQVEAYFQEHRHEYDLKTRVHVRNILMALPLGAEESVKNKAKDLAEKIRAEIRNERDFAKAAVQYSDAPNAKNGGDLGLIVWDEIDPRIKEVLKDLEPGQVSRPLLTAQGWQIFQLVERQENDPQTEARIKEEIREMLTQELLKKKYEEWVKELKGKATIDIKL